MTRLLIRGAAVTSFVALGIFLISWGNHLAAQDYYYNVVPWGLWGAFFLALPLIAGAIWLLAAVMRAAAAEHRRYRAWGLAWPREGRGGRGCPSRCCAAERATCWSASPVSQVQASGGRTAARRLGTAQTRTRSPRRDGSGKGKPPAPDTGITRPQRSLGTGHLKRRDDP